MIHQQLSLRTRDGCRTCKKHKMGRISPFLILLPFIPSPINLLSNANNFIRAEMDSHIPCCYT